MNDRPKSRHIVEINLDPVPGWGNRTSDHEAMLVADLVQRVPHYDPVVKPLLPALVKAVVTLVNQRNIITEVYRPGYREGLVDMVLTLLGADLDDGCARDEIEAEIEAEAIRRVAPEPCSRCGWQYDEKMLAAVRRGEVVLDDNPTHLCQPSAWRPALSDCANWRTNERGDCGGRVEQVGDTILCETCRNR